MSFAGRIGTRYELERIEQNTQDKILDCLCSPITGEYIPYSSTQCNHIPVQHIDAITNLSEQAIEGIKPKCLAKFEKLMLYHRHKAYRACQQAEVDARYPASALIPMLILWPVTLWFGVVTAGAQFPTNCIF